MANKILKNEIIHSRVILRSSLLVVAVMSPILTILIGPFDKMAMQLIYNVALPSCPFILLSILASFKSQEGKFRYSKGAIIGSMVGALCSVYVPYAVLWYSSITYSGGGANIGIGLFLLAMPLHLLIAMAAGWHIGIRKHAI